MPKGGNILDVTERYIKKVDRLISRWARRKSKKKIFHKLTREGLPCGLVYNLKELMEDPHIARRKMFLSTKDDLGKKHVIIGNHIKLSTYKLKIQPPPTNPSYHNVEVYTKILGLSKEELEKLKKENII